MDGSATVSDGQAPTHSGHRSQYELGRQRQLLRVAAKVLRKDGLDELANAVESAVWRLTEEKQKRGRSP